MKMSVALSDSLLGVIKTLSKDMTNQSDCRDCPFVQKVGSPLLALSRIRVFLYKERPSSANNKWVSDSIFL